jgi:hypothetical protein
MAKERSITPEPRKAAKRAPNGMARGSYYAARRSLGERIRNWDWRSNAQIDVDDYNTDLASGKKFAENTAANIERLKRAGLSEEEAKERAARMEQSQRQAFRNPQRSSDGAGRNTVEQELEMQDLERRNAQKPLEARAALQKEQTEENRRLGAIDRRNLGITEGGLQATREATAAARARTDAIAKDREAWNAEREAKRRSLEDERFKKGFGAPELDTDSKLNILGWEARKAGFDKVTDESMRGRFDAAKKQMQIDYEKGIREGRIDPHMQFNPTDDDVINHMRTNLQGSAKRRERSIAAGEQARKQSAAEKRAMIKDYGGAIAARSFGGAGGSYNGGFSGGMSQAQMEAKARWDAERAARSGTRGNLAAFQETKAYRASPQYGQDVYGMAQRNGRTLTPGSVGNIYEQNYNHNLRMNEARERSAQGNAATVQGLANAVDSVPVNGNPTPAQTKAVAQTPVTTGADTTKNFGS